MNVHVSLRKICQRCLPLIAFPFRCLNRRIHAKPREQTEEKLLLDKRKLNAAQESETQLFTTIMCWKKRCLQGQVTLNFANTCNFFLFFFSLLESPEATLVLPFIKMRGVVYGRYCSTKLWRYFLPWHNSGNPSSEDVFIQRIYDCSEFKNGILEAAVESLMKEQGLGCTARRHFHHSKKD